MSTDDAQPTVVLVHGAFADASSWNGVIERLQAAGVTVTAPANPLRGIPPTPPTSPACSPDPRPGAPRRPLLRRRGHHERRVQGRQRRRPRLRRRLRPRRGRDVLEIDSDSRDSVLLHRPGPAPVPDAGTATETAVEFAIDPAKFHDVFAADLPAGADRRDGAPPSGRSRSWRSPSRPARPPGRPAGVGGGRHRRQGRRQRRRALDGRARRRRRSPRSRART